MLAEPGTGCRFAQQSTSGGWERAGTSTATRCTAVERQWSVVSGQWSVVSGQWSVVSGQWSVVEQPQACTHHGHVVFVTRGDDVLLAHGAARLNDVLDATGMRAVNIVAERNIGIRAQRHPAQRL